MIRILYVTSTLKRSGPTNQLYNIIKYLNRDKYDPCLITLSPEPKDSRWKDYEELGVNLYSLNLTRLGTVFYAKYQLNKLVRVISPDLIHTQGIRPDILSSQLSFNCPKIATIRNLPQLDYLMSYGFLLGRFMVWCHTWAMKDLSVCVGVSNAVKRNLTDNFDVLNTCTILNGVDVEIYNSVDSEEKKNMRKHVGLPEFGRVWISSGHLSERKDPLFLIHMWKKFFLNNFNEQLVFIGDGDERARCEEESSELKNVHIVGRVKNVEMFLKASDYFISSSRAEGLPNAVLESLACGLPVLLSDIGPHKEILEMEPGIGEAYQVGDKEDFIRAFGAMFIHSREDRSSAALKIIDVVLSAQKMSLNYLGMNLTIIWTRCH